MSMGHIVRCTALELVSEANMWASPRPGRGLKLVDGWQLLIGRDVTDDVLATYACRKLVELRDGVCTERAVRLELRKHGFRYAEYRHADVRGVKVRKKAVRKVS